MRAAQHDDDEETFGDDFGPGGAAGELIAEPASGMQLVEPGPLELGFTQPSLFPHLDDIQLLGAAPTHQHPSPSATLTGNVGSGGARSRRGASQVDSGSGAADKQAQTRERNRLAQQRSREMARQRRRQMEAQAAAMERQMAALRLENERLAFEQRMMQKLLRVRHAMLTLGSMMGVEGEEDEEGEEAVGQLQLALQQQPPAGAGAEDSAAPRVVPKAPPTTAAATRQPSAELFEARNQLMLALDSVPLPDELEEPTNQLPHSSSTTNIITVPATTTTTAGTPAQLPPPGTASQAAGMAAAAPSAQSQQLPTAFGAALVSSRGAAAAAGEEAGAAGGGVAVAGNAGAPGSSGPGPDADTGLALSVALKAAAIGCADGQLLVQAGLPQPDKPTFRQLVQGMSSPEDIRSYWMRWREQLRRVYQAAQAEGFSDAGRVQEMEELLSHMVEVYWHAAHLCPHLFHAFLLTTLPPDGTDPYTVWGPAVEESLAMLNGEELAGIQLAWRRYIKRLAVSAAGMRPVVQRLQELSQAPAGASLAQLADRTVQLRKHGSRLKQFYQEPYVATLTFLADLGSCTGIAVRCLWQLASDTYLPDHPSIVAEILRLQQQSKHNRTLCELQTPAGLAAATAAAAAATEAAARAAAAAAAASSAVPASKATAAQPPNKE